MTIAHVHRQPLLGSLPSTSPLRGGSLSGFRGPVTTLDGMAKVALGLHGEKSVIVRRLTEFFVGRVAPKDYLGEILAVRNAFVQKNTEGTPFFRYTNDPKHVELLKTPQRQALEINQNGTTLVDCDDIAAMAAAMLLQLGREVELVAMGFAPNSLSHVAVRAKEPKSGQWIFIDGVAGPREREAAHKAQEVAVRKLD